MMGPRMSLSPDTPLTPTRSYAAALARLQGTRWQRLSWLYALCGMVWCALSVTSMSLVELGCIPVGVAFLVSLDLVWPFFVLLFRQSLMQLLVAWAAWMGLSLLWTPDLAKGGWEMAGLRFTWTIAALWPLVRYRRWLIYALCAGFLATNASQLALWIGHTLDLPWLSFKPWHPRNAGWWPHPAVCGYMLVAALGLHLPTALMGRGWKWPRLFSFLGCAASVLGMIGTGTRGAWIAGAALVVVVAGVSVATGRWSRRTLAIGAVVVAAMLGATWLAAGDVITRRAKDGYDEARAALVERQYETDTGARIKFAGWALRMSLERPLQGHGAGSYEHWTRERLRTQGIDPDTVRTAPQGHNLWLHAFGTLGIAGLGLAVAIAWAALRAAAAPVTRETLGTYESGPFFALVGMILTTPFDVAYVNSPPSALLAVLFALALLGRAQREVDDPGNPV